LLGEVSIRKKVIFRGFHEGFSLGMTNEEC